VIRVEVLTVTCPAATPQAAAIETPFHFPPGRVERVEITIPAGHAFLTGIQLAESHTPLVPWTAGQFIIGDDDHLAYEIVDPLQNGSWSVFTYNTDQQYPHTWQVRWLVRDLATIRKSSGLQLLSPAAIAAGGLGPINQG